VQHFGPRSVNSSEVSGHLEERARRTDVRAALCDGMAWSGVNPGSRRSSNRRDGLTEIVTSLACSLGAGRGAGDFRCNGLLDLGRQNTQMLGKSCEQLLLLQVSGQIADQFALGCIRAKRLQARLKVVHFPRPNHANQLVCISARAEPFPNKAILHMRADYHPQSGCVRRSRDRPTLAAAHFPKETISSHLASLKTSPSVTSTWHADPSRIPGIGLFACERFRAKPDNLLHLGHDVSSGPAALALSRVLEAHALRA
jgi:hypothetical protein